jgi:hypothetical protein
MIGSPTDVLLIICPACNTVAGKFDVMRGSLTVLRLDSKFS